MSSETLEIHGAHAHADEHNHAHQFDSAVQQKDAVVLGMWAFLATEVLFFGALFMIYITLRYRFNEMWLFGSNMLDITLGATNTVILLVSSFTMALGVWSAQTGQKKKVTLFLSLTLLCAFGFLVVKSFEYSHKWHENLIPGPKFSIPAHDYELWAKQHTGDSATVAQGPFEPAAVHEFTSEPVGGRSDLHDEHSQTATDRPALAPIAPEGLRNLQMFYALYFAMTGLHALHVIIGIGLISGLIWLNHRGWFSETYNSPVEMVGLYWHFVDIVWVFLYPLLYLMDRSHYLH